MDAGQARREEALASKARREVEWLRRGAKARTGKSSARIAEAGRLLSELKAVQTRNAPVSATPPPASERRLVPQNLARARPRTSSGSARSVGARL